MFYSLSMRQTLNYDEKKTIYNYYRSFNLSSAASKDIS